MSRESPVERDRRIRQREHNQRLYLSMGAALEGVHADIDDDDRAKQLRRMEKQSEQAKQREVSNHFEREP